MKNSFFNKLVAIALIAFFTFGYACKKKEDAPEIPPQNSLVMNLDDFQDGTKSTKDILTAANWGHSVVKVFIWNVLLTIGMAVPVASFVESFNHEPKWHRRDGGYWSWEYSYSIGINTYNAELIGKVENDIVTWEMSINEFLWYSGESALDKTSGFWILNENASNPNELLEITWNDDHNGNADIKYLNIKPSGAENGGYIFYGKTSTGEFDRFYDIYNKSDDNLTEIEWNYSDKHGRVKDPGEFGDSDWHCWDTTLQDDSCMVAK